MRKICISANGRDGKMIYEGSEHDCSLKDGSAFTEGPSSESEVVERRDCTDEMMCGKVFQPMRSRVI